MPKGTRVARCVKHVQAQGKPKGNAIAICHSATGQGYQSGRPLANKPKAKPKN